jgi:tetratricopeptide (TPR) repeat protein
VNSQEYNAAKEELEKALETNPRSAAAHYELGCLCDTKLNDYAAAIYHYEQMLSLDSNSPRAPLVKERIRGCKLELAETEFPLPNSQNLQREVNNLMEENRLLKRQLDEARGHPGTNFPAPPAPTAAQTPGGLAGGPVAGSDRRAGQTPQPYSPGGSAVSPAPGSNTIPVVQPLTGSSTARVAQAGTETNHPRTYIVQAKDSIYSIASRYGVKVSAVEAVNPNVNPNHLRIGQSLNLP